MAAAGAAVGAARGQARYTIKKLGPKRRGQRPERRPDRRPNRGKRRRRRYALIGACVIVLLAAGGVTLSVKLRAGQRDHATTGTWLDVTGVGCPASSAAVVSVANASAGPGWTRGGGGWTGNGCDGSALWTMDPKGSQRVPSALTWKFTPVGGASLCTLAVFVPTRNALGMSRYAIFREDEDPQDLATVSFSQFSVDGRWVTLGSYPPSGGSLAIQLAPGHNAAVTVAAAVAASAARARCT